MDIHNTLHIMKYFLFISLYLFSFNGFSQPAKSFRIAFGSCNRQNLPQPAWKAIASRQPDLWLWLGDMIYGDSDDMNIIKNKYSIQLRHPDYKRFISKVKVMGVWDDHDYGRNDAGKQFPFKIASQRLALDFLKEPKNSPRRNQSGIYTSSTFKSGSKIIKVILLDGRFNRDTLMKDSLNAYIPNLKGDLLGEGQWRWLEDQLRSNADVFVIGSGIQIISEEHPHEKWANFPAARKRLFDLLVKTQAKGVILLSGDRHIGEFSKINLPGFNYPIYDITSSGLTHSAINNTSERNVHRVGPLVNQKHFGLMEFNDGGKSLNVNIQLIGLDSKTFHTETLRF